MQSATVVNNPTITVHVNGGPGVEVHLFTLISWKGALKLETVGMKASRGRSCASVIREAFGLPRKCDAAWLRANLVVPVLDDFHQQLEQA